MKCGFLPLLLLTAAPLQGAETPPQIEIGFSIERADAVLGAGSIFPSRGYAFEEVVGQAYPPVCPRGDVEHGYRRLKLAITYPNGRGDRFSIYLADVERFDAPEPDEDPCLSERTPPREHSFHGSVTLSPGESAQIDVGASIVLKLRRIR